MARPLRIEYEGALHHVMARGNDRAPIFLDDDDRQAFLDNLGRVTERFEWRIWAWCLMDNHYHLLVETLNPTLSKGMRQVNGVYTQAFNRRHGRVGHVLQGRYKSILVEKDSYLLELSRYVVLNPVSAGLVEKAEDWAWSSYRSVMGKNKAPAWLAVEDTLSLFHAQTGPARRAYARFVQAGIESDSPMIDIKRQSLLGSDAFVEKMAEKMSSETISQEVPKKARPAPSLPAIVRGTADRDEAIQTAYQTGAYTLSEIGTHFNLHLSTVSRIARSVRNARNKT